MKILTIVVAAALLSAGAAQAQSWSSINERQDRILHRIDRGVATGQLTRPEARRLRIEFRQIQGLEARYRRDGLNGWERRDLDRRLDALSAQVRSERADAQSRY